MLAFIHPLLEVAALFVSNSILFTIPKGNTNAFAPLEKATFEPDAVVFIVAPIQAMRLVFLNAFYTGNFDIAHMEPMCSGAMATPLSTGKIGLSFLCPGSREMSAYSPGVLGLGVPYEALHRIAKAIPYAHVGTALPDSEAMAKVTGRPVVLRRFEDFDKDLDKYFSGV